MSEPLTEEWLAALERRADPDSIPQLVQIIREQQHDLDALRLKVEVLQRDRDEMRAALLQAHAALRAAEERAGVTDDPPDGSSGTAAPRSTP